MQSARPWLSGTVREELTLLPSEMGSELCFPQDHTQGGFPSIARMLKGRQAACYVDCTLVRENLLDFGIWGSGSDASGHSTVMGTGIVSFLQWDLDDSHPGRIGRKAI